MNWIVFGLVVCLQSTLPNARASDGFCMPVPSPGKFNTFDTCDEWLVHYADMMQKRYPFLFIGGNPRCEATIVYLPKKEKTAAVK